MVSVGPRPQEAVLYRRQGWRYGWVDLVGRKTRTSRIKDSIVQALPEAAKVLDGLQSSTQEPQDQRLFGTVGGILLPRSAKASMVVNNRALRSIAEDAGLSFIPTMKTLRSTWATWHYVVFKDILLLKNVGGWENLLVVDKHYAGKASPRMAPDIAAIWGIDLGNLDPWREPPRGDHQAGAPGSSFGERS